MATCIGVLTAGGDSPGLNAALRGLGRAVQDTPDMHLIGFKDGFRGLAQDRTVLLEGPILSGILTQGGTILGTSRDKPHKMTLGGKVLDLTDTIVETYHRHHLDALVCLGGGGTIKNAWRLQQKGLRVITLPKTIDNDIPMTDVTFGFDTAMGIATEAIDRLHSTAHSHHRIIVVEIMGHRAGWLALGAGIAGGADVILIPELPYSVNSIANAILQRSRNGKRFSIVAVSEGALASEAVISPKKQNGEKNGKKKNAKPDAGDEEQSALAMGARTLRLAEQLQALTGLEARVTILGHLQRGGTPSAADRLLATRLGTACAQFITSGASGVMVAARGDGVEAVPLDLVAGKIKLIPPDHPWIDSARRVGTCLG